MEPIDLSPLIAAVEENPNDPSVLAASIIQLGFVVIAMQDEIDRLRSALTDHEAQRRHER